MKQDEYFALLKERWKQTDQTSRQAIHEYNEWKRELRHHLDEEYCHEDQDTAPATAGDRAEERREDQGVQRGPETSPTPPQEEAYAE